jgi:hypothetical protein
LGDVSYESNFIAPGLITKQVSQLRLFRHEKSYKFPSIYRTLKAPTLEIATPLPGAVGVVSSFLGRTQC